MYELFQEENRLEDYWIVNVFIPLFKNSQYYYNPNQLRKIFRFMMVLGHEVIINLSRKMTGSTTRSTRD